MSCYCVLLPSLEVYVPHHTSSDVTALTVKTTDNVPTVHGKSYRVHCRFSLPENEIVITAPLTALSSIISLTQSSHLVSQTILGLGVLNLTD